MQVIIGALAVIAWLLAIYFGLGWLDRRMTKKAEAKWRKDRDAATKVALDWIKNLPPPIKRNADGSPAESPDEWFARVHGPSTDQLAKAGR